MVLSSVHGGNKVSPIIEQQITSLGRMNSNVTNNNSNYNNLRLSREKSMRKYALAPHPIYKNKKTWVSAVLTRILSLRVLIMIPIVFLLLTTSISIWAVTSALMYNETQVILSSLLDSVSKGSSNIISQVLVRSRGAALVVSNIAHSNFKGFVRQGANRDEIRDFLFGLIYGERGFISSLTLGTFDVGEYVAITVETIDGSTDLWQEFYAYDGVPAATRGYLVSDIVKYISSNRAEPLIPVFYREHGPLYSINVTKTYRENCLTSTTTPKPLENSAISRTSFQEAFGVFVGVVSQFVHKTGKAYGCASTLLLIGGLSVLPPSMELYLPAHGRSVSKIVKISSRGIIRTLDTVDEDNIWYLITILPVSDFEGSVSLTAGTTVGISVAFSIVSTTLISFFIHLFVLRSLSLLTRSFRDINEMKLQSSTIAKLVNMKMFASEMFQLKENFQTMHSSLLSFSKYVPASVVSELVTKKKEAILGLEDANCYISFLDIKDFTTISEELTPDQLVRVMSEAFEGLSSIVLHSSAILDKFIGDCIMSFWECHPDNTAILSVVACQVGLASIRFLKSRRRIWQAQDLPALECRIGMHFGSVKKGNFGSEKRFQYTVIGDPVNTASRFEGLNKRYGSSIVISEVMYKQVMSCLEEAKRTIVPCDELCNVAPEHLCFRFLDYVAVKGKETALGIYQLFDKEDIPSYIDIQTEIENYNKAMDLMTKDKDIAAAKAAFEDLKWKDIVVIKKIMLCEEILRGEYAWDGVVKMHEK
ncbi:hypothetical protein ABK040_009070 [Willaertia magna]